MVNDLLTKEDLVLFNSGSRFTLGSIYVEEGIQDMVATFDVLIRDFPDTRNYLVFVGLEHVADYLVNLKITPAQLAWLDSFYTFSPRVKRYFKNFSFTGDVHAMPEGTLHFPGEPVVRITAPIVEAQMVETYVVNTIMVQTMLASKMARVVEAASGIPVVVGFMRSHGIDAAIKSVRVGKIVGINLPSLAVTAFKDRSAKSLMASGTFHYFLMSFESELAAMRAYMRHYPEDGFILVDTYDTINGIKHFIRAAKEVEARGKRAKGIMLDSGDLHRLSVIARKMLDAAGLRYIKILAMSNIDEYKVSRLVKKKSPIDIFAGVTEILTSSDAPKLEVVYKLSELRHGRTILPKMKTSAHKVSLPGRKQVFRVSSRGKYVHDVIGLENERVPNSKKMLVPVIKNGKLIKKPPSIRSIGAHYKRESKKFDAKLFDVNRRVRYPVKISQPLRDLTRKTKQDIRKHFVS